MKALLDLKVLRFFHPFGVALVLAVSFLSVSAFLQSEAAKADGCSPMAGLPPEIARLVGGDAGRCTAPLPKGSQNDEKPEPPKGPQLAKIAVGPITAIKGAHVPGEVLVVLRGGGGEAERLAGLYGLTILSRELSQLLGGELVRFGIPDARSVAEVRAILAREATVMDAEPNHIYELNGSTGKVKRFALKAAGLDAAHKLARGRGVKIGMIDSGVDGSHPALEGAIVSQFDGLSPAPLNDISHGTAIALLAGGAVEPFLGAAPEAEIYAARAFDKTKNGETLNSVRAILRSLDWLVAQDVDVINMSFAGPENKLLSKALNAVIKTDVVLVAAAGNNGAKAPFAYPAAVPGVIAVTALDAKNRIYNRANQGPYIYVAAPGVDVILPAEKSKVSLKSGTSYGAALVSGIAALVIEQRGRLSQDVFKKSLERSVKDLGPPGRDKVFGFGLVLAATLLKQAAE
jgi:subtilisin family serine protease